MFPFHSSKNFSTLNEPYCSSRTKGLWPKKYIFSRCVTCEARTTKLTFFWFTTYWRHSEPRAMNIFESFFGFVKYSTRTPTNSGTNLLSTWDKETFLIKNSKILAKIQVSRAVNMMSCHFCEEKTFNNNKEL